MGTPRGEQLDGYSSRLNHDSNPHPNPNPNPNPSPNPASTPNPNPNPNPNPSPSPNPNPNPNQEPFVPKDGEDGGDETLGYASGG